MANVFRLLKQSSRIAEVLVLPVIDPAGKQRCELATEAEAAVRVAFDTDNGSDEAGR